MPDKHFQLRVNGRTHSVEVAPETPLLYVLRDDLAMDGPHFGCGLAQCGACTVHLNGTAVRSCVTPIAAVGSQEVTTIEGLAVDGRMSRLQQALVDAQAPQCGYCIPGITMSAAALLKQTPHPTDAQIRGALEGNLCRCSVHVRVLRAVHAAAGEAT
jgi:nicotinate dehydrogenase subunit A